LRALKAGADAGDDDILVSAVGGCGIAGGRAAWPGGWDWACAEAFVAANNAKMETDAKMKGLGATWILPLNGD
jgi:hypothetical protein